MRREGVSRGPILYAVLPLGLMWDNGIGLTGGVHGVQRAGQFYHPGGWLGGHKSLQVDLRGYRFVGGIHGLEDQGFAVIAARGRHVHWYGRMIIRPYDSPTRNDDVL